MMVASELDTFSLYGISGGVFALDLNEYMYRIL